MLSFDQSKIDGRTLSSMQGEANRVAGDIAPRAKLILAFLLLPVRLHDSIQEENFHYLVFDL